MVNRETPALNVKWAVITFVLGYIVLTVVGFASYYILAAIMHVSLSAKFDISSDPAYMLSQQLNIAYNLVTWVLCAWVYFRRSLSITPQRAWALGLFWIVVALPADFVFYVLVPSPTQLTMSEYYVGQFPWIYLVYAVLAISPACLLLTRRPVHAEFAE
jgi:hypothetical protein